MFDFRYHVASLAAVFFALVIGILVGVALASHGLGNTERKRLEEDLRRAENQTDVLRTQVATLMNDSASDRAFVEGTYKSVMANRLRGMKIAVLFIGSSEMGRRTAITQALSDAGAGTPLRMRFVKVPIDPTALTRKLATKPLLANYAAPDQLKTLGHDLGQEFVVGTDTPLWVALQNLIVEEKAGPARPPADGVVIVRTAKAQTGPTALFLQRAGFSTVDDIDTRIGKLALVALLAEPNSTGAYGTKKAALAELPPIPPLPAPASG